MRTLTITDAKKNLGRWLTAAAKGEDIGIVCGADIIALRKVSVQSTDYAQGEYHEAPEQDALVAERTGRYRKKKRSGKAALTEIADLIGSVGGLPSDLSARKKHYLKATGYGQKRSR